jgi:hypothetical protein
LLKINRQCRGCTHHQRAYRLQCPPVGAVGRNSAPSRCWGYAR